MPFTGTSNTGIMYNNCTGQECATQLLEANGFSARRYGRYRTLQRETKRKEKRETLGKNVSLNDVFADQD